MVFFFCKFRLTKIEDKTISFRSTKKLANWSKEKNIKKKKGIENKLNYKMHNLEMRTRELVFG